MSICLVKKVPGSSKRIKLKQGKNITFVKEGNSIYINSSNNDINNTVTDKTFNNTSSTSVFNIITVNNTMLITELNILGRRISDNMCQNMKINSSFKNVSNIANQIGTNDYLQFKDDVELYTIDFIVSSNIITVQVNTIYNLYLFFSLKTVNNLPIVVI
ncbi:MAG: hypothetical protein ACXWE7_11825 [Nitrososphaeraceae archaeon]